MGAALYVAIRHGSSTVGPTVLRPPSLETVKRYEIYYGPLSGRVGAGVGHILVQSDDSLGESHRIRYPDSRKYPKSHRRKGSRGTTAA